MNSPISFLNSSASLPCFSNTLRLIDTRDCLTGHAGVSPFDADSVCLGITSARSGAGVVDARISADSVCVSDVTGIAKSGEVLGFSTTVSLEGGSKLQGATVLPVDKFGF